VQDELYARRDEVWALLEAGAVVYVCGDASRMAADVRRKFVMIYAEKAGVNEAAAEQWLNELTAQQKYLVDVWASN
jgi:cytochrome P450 / NADPH-cytochrome P450 reductase